MNPPISCYIRAKNEERLIAEVITAARQIADEVVVIDSGGCGRDQQQPGPAKANVESAIIYGLSGALHERVTFKGGAVEQSNFHDYNVMRMSDLPDEMNVRFVEVDTRPTGLGEIGNPFIGGAISNAVAKLTGKRLRHMPFTPDRVLASLKA